MANINQIQVGYTVYDIEDQTARNLISTKQSNITGAASTITSSNLTASKALVSDSSGKVAVSPVTSTELGYLNGTTSAVQTQLNNKISEPTSDGTNGQILTTDGNGGRSWTTVSTASDAQVTTAVTTWLNENVTPGTGVTLDRTLSISNAAAPADLVGDLKSAFTQSAEKQETLTGDYVEIDYNSGTVIPTVNNVTGQTDIKLGISKGNILCLPYFRPNNFTANGLTFTINEDKSITVNGTATADTFYNIAYYQKPVVFTRMFGSKKRYGFFLKGCTDGSDSTYYLIDRQTGRKSVTGAVDIFASAPQSTVNLCLWVANGVTLTDKTFYPMLCLTGTEEWTSPITPYSATVESTQATYTFNNISLNDGYNAIVTNEMNTLSVNVVGYYNLEEMQSELDTLKESVGNVWEGKKWVAFGTSITDNYSANSYITQGEHAGEHTGKYVPYLLDMSKLSESVFVNRGIAGGSINGHILYYIRYYTADEANADLITIEGAVNDFATSVPLGQVGDTVPYTNSLLSDSTAEGTFAGACYQAFTTAITNSPNAVVVLLTETTGKNHVGYANYSQTRKNGLNLTQWDYIDMTIKVAEYVGIPVIKCGQDSMINAQNPQYIADHIHHTYLGGYQYAKTIWSKLRGIPLKATEVPE